MTLSGIPVADPYFAAARRDPSSDDAAASSEAPTRIVADEVDEVVAAVLARVGFFTAELRSTLGPDTEQDPEITLRAADHDSDVRVEARVTEPASDPSVAFGRLQSELEQRGWDVTPPAGSAPLEAHLAGGVVTASYADSGLELTVDSAPVPVGAERAAALVRDGVIA